MNKDVIFCSEKQGDPVTADEMKEIERRADEAGLSYEQMMENAGVGAADYICSENVISGKRILIFCGKGNNGGDGFVAARKLTQEGAKVTLILVEGSPKTKDAIVNMQRCEAIGIPAITFSQEEAERFHVDADLIIDGIYGTGFHGILREPARTAARLMNSSEAKVYSLDIPSGLNSDTGDADEDAVRADCTIVFHRLKPAHLNQHSRQYCGRSVCISIGIEGYLDKR